MFRFVIPFAVLTVSATFALAQNPHVIGSDLRPRNAAGRIEIDAFDDVLGQVVPAVRTFGWRFQTIPGDPYFLQDPGFNATSASGLPGGSALGFNLVLGLRYFTGSGPVSFTNTPAGETLTLNFGAGNVTISDATTPQPGFNFVTLAPNGSAHRHLNSVLNPGTAPTPATGVYLTAIRVTDTAGLTPSDAMYLVFNNGAAPLDYDRTIRYVATPFPGDANFSGAVDIDDFGILAANFNRPADQFWHEGDFNNDRMVDIDDFGLLAANFNQQAPTSAAGVNARGGAVPEPAAGTLIALAALFSRRVVSRRARSLHVFRR